MNHYFIMTNGLSGDGIYKADNPDEALTFARQHEIFLRLLRKYPSIPVAMAGQLAKEDCDLPDFRVTCCILHREAK